MRGVRKSKNMLIEIKLPNQRRVLLSERLKQHEICRYRVRRCDWQVLSSYLWVFVLICPTVGWQCWINRKKVSMKYSRHILQSFFWGEYSRLICVTHKPSDILNYGKIPISYRPILIISKKMANFFHYREIRDTQKYGFSPVIFFFKELMWNSLIQFCIVSKHVL